ncbi:MAG TPA: hypothetical protein VHR44_06530 [Beijerinckiaceae bacterium]|nr:hypothetical protein [Beijerinckiaceae bacterium]
MRKATGLLALLALCGGLAALAEDAKPIDPGVLDDLPPQAVFLPIRPSSTRSAMSPCGIRQIPSISS